MIDLGAQVSYLVLELGTPVHAAGAEQPLGRVSEIRSDDDKDIFGGLIVDCPAGERYVQADLIDAVYERGVVLALDDAAFAALPAAPPGRG